MSVIRCVRRAAAAGRLSDQDRKRLEAIYATAYNDARGGAHGEAERQANEAFDRTLTILAQERRRAATLQAEAEQRILADAARFKNRKGEADIGEFGQRLINRVHFDAQALFRIDMAELSALAHEFGRTILSGKRINPARAVLMLREVFGEDTGDETARTLAQAWRALSRRKIDQFNGAGGNVAVREDWHVPQRHDGAAVAKAGFDEWRAVIADSVAPERMINPNTGLAFRPHEFEEALRDVFETIVWHGMGDDAEVGRPGAAFWRRRNDARFFVFRDADAWLRYHKRFGGDQHIFEVMAGYLRSINHDIAAMQRLGPNPRRAVEWLAGTEGAEGGLIMQHARDADAGRSALFPRSNDLGKTFKTAREREQYARNKAMAVSRAWRHFTGEARRPVHAGWAEAEGNLNNIIYANALAFTPTLAGADLVNQAATRAFNSVSVRGMMRDLVDALRLSRDRKELAEMGVEIDTGLSAMLSEARDSAVMHGGTTSRYIVDRAFTFSALKPMTMGFRAMWTMGVLHDVARHHATPYERLPQNFRAMLARYDIDAAAWEFIQATPLYQNNGLRMVRPKDIAQTDIFALTGRAAIEESVVARPGLTRGEEVALRLMSLIQEEGEGATISGTPRSARIFPFRPGSITGTFIGSLSRLKTYTLSHWQHHAYRAAEIFWREGGGIRGMGGAARYYGLSLIVPSMFLVGVGTVLAEMAQGKDPPDVSDWRFWDRVFWRTVSLGFFQDVFQGVFEPESRLNSAARFTGPTLQRLTSLMSWTGDVFKEGAAAVGLIEDDTNLGRSTIRTARQFVPRAWATDLAVDRLAWDNLQRMVDPEADADFARRAARAEQGMWAPPGQAPFRWPDLSTLDLTNQDQDPALGVR